MISTNSIKFDTNDFKQVDASPGEINWINPDTKENLTLHYFEKPPDIPCSLQDIKALRQAYRERISAAEGGLISIETKRIQRLNCLLAIFKLPQKPHGMTYLGSLTFPFATCSFVIRLLCQELSPTGLRDAVIANEFLASGQLSIDLDSGKMLGWSEDPYEPSHIGPALKNRSEDVCYDARFPDHPLSRLRNYLMRIENSLQAAPELYELPSFN